VKQALAIEALPSSLTKSKVLADWLGAGGGAIDARELQNLSSDTVVRFTRPQLQTVVDGLLSNAVKSVDEDRLQIDVSISMQPPVNPLVRSVEGFVLPPRSPVFLLVGNTTAKVGKDVDALAKRLTEVEDASVVGVLTIHLGCSACGYRPPRWFVKRGDQDQLVASVQIGELGS
jgi:hypothetical protein